MIASVSPFGLLKQDIINGMAYKQQKFTSYNCGGWKFKIKAPNRFGVW